MYSNNKNIYIYTYTNSIIEGRYLCIYIPFQGRISIISSARINGYTRLEVVYTINRAKQRSNGIYPHLLKGHPVEAFETLLLKVKNHKLSDLIKTFDTNKL